MPPDPPEIRKEIERILTEDFDCGVDIARLLLDLSADEFRAAGKRELGSGIGVTRFKQNKDEFLQALERIGLGESIKATTQRKLHWSDILVERLKAGRGSAIKGQKRGRNLEMATEAVVREVFGKDGYKVRCRFVGKGGIGTEKTDFAIPTKEEPRILIEAKAYGATGSKQTDVLGDVRRIIEEKRSDTVLLLVVDGITWNERVNDLRKLVEMQVRGDIGRIYTTRMFQDLREDLVALKADHHL